MDETLERLSNKQLEVLIGIGQKILDVAAERDELKTKLAISDKALYLALKDNHDVPSVNECRHGTECGKDCTIECKVPSFKARAERMIKNKE